MHRSWKRSAAAVPHTVMARLVQAIYSSTCAATDGPDKPGHDDVGTSRTIGQTPDFAVGGKDQCPATLFSYQMGGTRPAMTEKQRPVACPPWRCRRSPLLAFSRWDTPQATAIEAEPLLSGLVALLRPAIGRHVAMRVQAAPDLPRLLADRAELEAVLINLVNNARDAMPDGGSVTLAAGPACAPETAEVPPGLAAGRYLRLS